MNNKIAVEMFWKKNNGLFYYQFLHYIFALQKINLTENWKIDCNIYV